MHKEYMTSRERVIAAVSHREADRVPIDLGVHFSTGISAYAYRNLRRYLGMSVDHIEMIDCIQCLARVDNDIIDRFHIDTMLLNPPFPKTGTWNPREDYSFIVPDNFNPVLQKDGSYQFEMEGEKLRMPEGGFFFDGGWPDFYAMSSEDRLDFFAKRAEYIYKETDKYTMYMGFGAFFGGLEFACDMLTDPDDCIERNKRYLENQIKYFDRVNAKLGKYINCIELNGDLGTQDGPMCTPDSYEECCLPFLTKFCEHVHNTSDIHVFMHSCGSIPLLVPYIVESGVDILNPVQISARGMDSNMLKNTYGDKICFWGGGCNTQTVLNNATPEQVREHVKEQVQTFKPNGGFVFNQVHNIMGDIKPENIVAMLDTAYENSFYD